MAEYHQGTVRHQNVEYALDPQPTSPTAYTGTVASYEQPQQQYAQPQHAQPQQQYAQPQQAPPPPVYDYEDSPREEGLPAPPTYEHEPAMQGEALCVLVTHVLIALTYYMVGSLYGIVACKWDFTDSLYFSTVTITTVGYGDYSAMNCKGVTGNKTGHQVFMIFFILFGLATVASIISSTVAFVSTYMSKGKSGLDLEGKNDSEFDRQPRKGDRVMLCRYTNRTEMNGHYGEVVAELDEGYEVRLDGSNDECSIRLEHLEILFQGRARADVEQQYARSSKKELDKARVEWFKVVAGSFLTMAALVTVGAIFFCVNEDWAVIDGVYWSFTTVTTVGYGKGSNPDDAGQFLRHTSSKLFSVFYILISVTLLGAAIGCMGSAWTTVKYKQKKVDMLHRKLKAADFEKINEATRIMPGAHTGVDAGEFLAYWLIEEGLVDQFTCFHYLRHFYRLDTSNQGLLAHEDLVRLCGRAYARPRGLKNNYMTDEGHGYPIQQQAPHAGSLDQYPAHYDHGYQ